jgi:putative peptidoglycan lipid II flippase
LILLREPIITFLFQRGEFSQYSTELVSWALLWYTMGLLGHGIVEILSRAFYAMHDTKTPVFLVIGAMSLNVLFSIIFSSLFSSIGWMPFGGLALANTLATALESMGLWIIMRKRLSGMEGRTVFTSAAKAGIAVLLMSLSLLGWLRVSIDFPTGVIVAVGIMLGAIIYGASLYLLKSPEINILISYFRRRF